MFFEIFIQMMPYLAVFAVLGYIGRAQQKRLKKGKRNRKRVLLELVM